MTAGAETECAPGIGDGLIPLAALLIKAESSFVADFDRRMKESEFCALSLAHSRNVLRHLSRGPLRAAQLVERGNVTKQAISQQITHLQANGYITVEPDATDQRARVITLTPKGIRAQRLVAHLFVEIEQSWAEKLPHGDGEALRRILVQIMQWHPGGPDRQPEPC